jgi:hypothetical protein
MILREKFAAPRLCQRASRFLFAAAVVSTAFLSASAQVPTDLTSAQFAPNCGAANVTQIFADGFLASGQAGINDMNIVSDPDVVLIGNQWWLIFASNPGPTRGIEPVAAYLPPGVSLSHTGVFPTDPQGWHLVGAKADGTGKGVAIDGTPSSAGWDTIAAETPSIDVGPDGTVSVYYAGHNLGATNFEIGLMNNVTNGVAASGDPVPAMVATQPWEFADDLGAILEQSVRWIPELNKFIMYYTAGAWWDQPPTNDIAYAESTDGITWTNRQHLGFPKSYYNQDFVFNAQRNRFEMVVANDPTGVGGGNGRDLVWLDSASTGTHFSDWQNQVTLLDHTSPGTPTWRDQGLLSPAIKYGNLPGEENRIYVFFHAYGSVDPMSISRFYCDATSVTDPGFTLTAESPAMNLEPNLSAIMPISVNPINGFTGAVNFSVSSVPAGVSTTFLTTSDTVETILGVAVAPGTPAGRYPITVTGTSGNLTREATFTLTVYGQSQTITFPDFSPNNITFGQQSTFVLNATSSSGLPVTYSVGGNGTINGNVLTVTGGNDIIVAANQAGNATYSPAPQVTATLHVAPETQQVLLAPIAPQTIGGSLDLSPYVSTTSGLTGYTWVDVSSGVCTSNGGSLLQFVSPGTCVVIIIQFGNVDYAPAGVAAFITVNPYSLNMSAANVSVVAGATPTQTVASLLAGYTSPGLTPDQLGAALANAEIGFTVAGPGFSYNIPLLSYGTYDGANLLSAVPANAPAGTYTLTPYISGPGAANFTFTPTAGTLTIDPPGTQLLTVTAANITVIAGATPTQTVAQLMASYSAPGLTGQQLAAKFSNLEVGFTVTGPGFSNNIPLFSYGTYDGMNLLAQVPAGAPAGTYTLTPYMTGSGAAGFAFNEVPGTLSIAEPNVVKNNRPK